jgi:hypothetical protein
MLPATFRFIWPSSYGKLKKIYRQTLYAYCVSCVNRITTRLIVSSSDVVYTTDETSYKQLYHYIYAYNLSI